MTEKILGKSSPSGQAASPIMFDVPRVQREAYERGFYELVLYLEEHKAQYSRFILTGEADIKRPFDPNTLE